MTGCWLTGWFEHHDEGRWPYLKKQTVSLVILSPKSKAATCILWVQSLKLEFSLKAFYGPRLVASLGKLRILVGATLGTDQGYSAENEICENWAISNKAMVKKVLWISLRERFLIPRRREAGSGRFCYCTFSNGAKWNVRLFPGPVDATIKKSRPLTNSFNTILCFSLISLKPSFLAQRGPTQRFAWIKFLEN